MLFVTEGRDAKAIEALAAELEAHGFHQGRDRGASHRQSLLKDRCRLKPEAAARRDRSGQPRSETRRLRVMRHNPRLMRRFVALLVLVLLPLQLAFAAVAEYCEIGGADGGQHFGHHVHKLDKSKSKAKGGDESKGGIGSNKSAGEPDCGFCILGCAHAQASSLEIQMIPLTARHDVADGALQSGFLPPIFDRPPILSLA